VHAPRAVDLPPLPSLAHCLHDLASSRSRRALPPHELEVGRRDVAIPVPKVNVVTARGIRFERHEPACGTSREKTPADFYVRASPRPPSRRAGRPSIVTLAGTVGTKSLVKLKGSVRELTKRNNGHCLASIIARLNPILRGWYEYFKHSYRTTFEPIDGWVRMRLRSILRRRQKKRGAGRGWSNIRWPNAHFAKLGLFTMATVRAAARQSR
jgi:hypothetical protein